MAEWKITPIDEFVQDLGNGNFKFIENNTTQDRNYTVTYTDDRGCTGQKTYKIPACDNCKDHWNITSIYTPETRATHTVSLKNGKGGIAFRVYHDGVEVNNLTENDFIITFSNQGATLNEIIKPAPTSEYIMNIDTNACGHRGEDLDVIISVKDKEGEFQGCEDIGRLCFTYGVKMEWTVEVEGLTNNLTDIGFIGYTSEPCAENKIEIGGGALPVAGGVVKGKLSFYEDMEIIWDDPANNPYDWDSNIPSGVKPLLVGRLAGTGIDDNPHRAHVVQIGNAQTPKYIKVKYQ